MRSNQVRALVSLIGAPALLGTVLCGQAFAGGDDFSFQPPGTLLSGSGQGRVDNNVYAPAMQFPMETGPAFANSQVWGHGGGSGPGGSQCDVENFSYPWWDNYCETRSWDMPLCPSGTGHQGQDIRAATCDKNVHWVVAGEAGTITNVGSYSVYVTTDDGTRYDYLHMGSVQVNPGQAVQRGQRLGRVSNEFGGTPTTVHLHFNIRQSVAGVGTVYVPPYMSLVSSYQALIGPPPNPAQGVFEVAACNELRGWAASPTNQSVPIDVRLYFDGEKGDGATIGHPVLADQERSEPCGEAGCAHGFDVYAPLSLFDGQSHAVRGYASDGGPLAPELGESPREFSCAFELPSGIRRPLADADTKLNWRLSTFWDEVAVSDGVIASLSEGPELASSPRVVRSSDGSVVLIDRGVRRGFVSDKSARAWGVSGSPLVEAESALDAVPLGKPMPERPVVLRSAGGDLYLVDETDVSIANGVGGAGGGGETGALDDDAGCDCSLPGGGRASDSAPPHGVWLGLGVLAWFGRRGRRRQ